MIDSIIFDLDGTLWDSCETVAESWQKTLRANYDPDAKMTAADIAGIMGMTADGIVTALFSQYGTRAAEICRRCMDEECIYCGEHGGLLYPGLEAALLTLSRSRRLFIVSNCQVGYIQCFLKYTRFGKYFADYIEQGSTGLTKGENIRLLIQRHGLRSPVYVGDTASDMAAADAAGVPFIYAAYGFGHVTADVPTIVSLDELPALIHQM